jgi:hypothetical protein
LNTKQFSAISGSAMKSILIPTEDHDAMPAVLEAARLIARAFDSYMKGLRFACVYRKPHPY